jgi:hypothetical protein
MPPHIVSIDSNSLMSPYNYRAAAVGKIPAFGSDLQVAVISQRFAFLFAVSRARVLAAAGFFPISAPMLARRASIKLMTRGGVTAGASDLWGKPACFCFKSSTSAL